MNRLRRRLFLLAVLVIILVLLMPLKLAAQDDGFEATSPIVESNVEAFLWSSPVKAQDYLILVGLPSSYLSSDQTYPVLYVTDPQITFGTLMDAHGLLRFNAEIPDMIIVAIGYPEIQQFGTAEHDAALSIVLGNRQADMAPQRDIERFLEFVTDTVIPYIDANYQTDPSDRGIAGVSLGGEFVLYALVHAQDTFSRFLAVSPSSPTACASCAIVEEAPGPLSGKVFIATGDSPTEHGIASRVERTLSSLEAANHDELDVSFQVFEDSTHFSVLPLALARGLKAIYCEEPSGRCDIPAPVRG